MIQLSREIRFSLSQSFNPNVSNSWAGWPSTNRIVPWLILRCSVRGTPNPQTGYVCNVKNLDYLLRDVAVTQLMPNYRPDQTAEQILRTAYATVMQTWNDAADISSLELDLSPYLTFSIQTENSKMITMTQQFEFSAAHRLHCDSLSEQENRDVFGKCNNPQGHGHNYVLDVSVQNNAEQSDPSKPIIPLAEFEATVKRLIIDRLDHKNLNHDVAYFEKVNPSVENIAIAVWSWLEGQFGDARLSSVKVYETPKTWAEYRG